MTPFTWADARTLDDALAQVGPTAWPKAGGVELMDLMKEHLAAPERLVNLRTVPGLDRVEDRGAAGVRIGPLVTLARLAEDPLVRSRLRALADAAGHAATPQIRNMATAGGNLLQRPRCWYLRSEAFPCLRKGGTTCYAMTGENQYHAVFGHDACAAVHPSSLAPALVALGASIELRSARGARVVPVEAMFLDPAKAGTRDTVRADDEILTALVVPAPGEGASATSAYGKHAEKESYDWPLVEVAVALERRGGVCVKASVVLGAVAPRPWRAQAAEAVLSGKVIDAASAEAAGKAALVGAAPLRDNAYKLPLLEVAVRRAVLAAAEAT